MLECRRQIRIIQPSLRYGHTEKNRQIRNNRQTRKNRKARTNRPTEKQGQILKKGQTGQQNFFFNVGPLWESIFLTTFYGLYFQSSITNYNYNFFKFLYVFMVTFYGQHSCTASTPVFLTKANKTLWNMSKTNMPT